MKPKATQEKRNRVYFSHYGYVWSYSLADAITLAKKAITKGCDHGNGDGGKHLAGVYPCLSRSETRSTPSKFYKTSKLGVQVCLDWESSDWEYLLEQLEEL